MQSDTTEAGCDRVKTLRLHVRPTYEITLPDTSICYSSLLCLGEDCYYKHETGTWSRMLSSVYDCDSLVSIAVTVEDEIVPTVSVTQMSETELEASVTVGGTGWSQYSINGQGAYDADYVFRTDVPGTYEYRFMVDGSDCDSVVAVQILPTCLRNLIYQRWDDVLSLKNMATQMAETGHAVDMVAFQWVCNDEVIPGATDSYYYAPDSTVRPLGSCNKVIEATRTFNDLNGFHHLTAQGIVDRDRRDDGEVDYLRRKNILVPDVAEIENMLLLPEIVSAVAASRGRDGSRVAESVRRSVLKMFGKEIDEQALQHTRHRVKRTVEYRVDGRFADIGALEKHISSLTREINPRGMYEQFRLVVRRVYLPDCSRHHPALILPLM